MDEDQRHAEIKRVLELLPVREEEAWRVPLAISELVVVTQPSPMNPAQLKGMQSSFRDTGADGTKRELQKLVNIGGDDFTQLKERTAALHQPAILLLADFGWFRDLNDLDGARTAAKRALKHIESGRWASQSRGHRGPPSAQRGRPFNLQSQGIALVAARLYMQLTGRPITVSHHIDKDDFTSHPMGEFFSLLERLFNIAGINDDAEAAIHRIRKRILGKYAFIYTKRRM